jgi:DNA-binding NarL/FixJ family response regulator
MPGVAVVAADRRVRDSVASLLTASGQVHVLGAAGDAESALRLVDGEEAQVVVLDRGLSNGAAKPSLLARLRDTLPAARILVIEWGGEGAASIPEGADAVLDIGDQPAALLDAILAPSRPAAPTGSRGPAPTGSRGPARTVTRD